MGQVEGVVVPRFSGVKRSGLTKRISNRQPLDTPRELMNFHLTRDGHLYMPDAADLVWDFSAHGDIRSIVYVENPRGLVVQMTNGRIYHISIEPPSSVAFPDPMIVTHIATMGAGEEGYPLWTNGISSGTLMGYAPRGSAGPDGDGRTWLLGGTWDAPTVTNLTGTVTPTASASMLYKGRRFWVKRGRQVFFSELNDFTTARPVDNTFTISGDDTGSSHLDNPGMVAGMTGMEDMLIFFMGGSVWMLTGSGPETWQLRQSLTVVGNISQNTLVRIDEGVLTVGGSNLNSRGLYLFTGSNAVPLSEDVGAYMRSLGQMRSATLSAHKYVMSTGRESPAQRQFLVYDTRTREWSTFNGFTYGVTATQSSRILVGGAGKLYRNSGIIFPRAPGYGAKLITGYMDEENPSGLIRFLGLKVTGRRYGTGVPTLLVTAKTDKSTVVAPVAALPNNIFDNLVIPLNVRGSAVEITLEITPANDDNEVLIENLQLIMSRKGEKVSRG